MGNIHLSLANQIAHFLSHLLFISLAKSYTLFYKYYQINNKKYFCFNNYNCSSIRETSQTGANLRVFQKIKFYPFISIFTLYSPGFDL